MFGFGSKPEATPPPSDFADIPNSYDSSKRCVRVVGSQSEFDELHKTAAADNQMLVMKYVKKDCPACAVVTIAVEKLCKKYAHFPYVKFYEVTETRTPDVVANQVDKTPQVDTYMGRLQLTQEMDVSPPLHVRKEAMRKVENISQMEEVRGNKLGKDEMQRLMMSELV